GPFRGRHRVWPGMTRVSPRVWRSDGCSSEHAATEALAETTCRRPQALETGASVRSAGLWGSWRQESPVQSGRRLLLLGRGGDPAPQAARGGGDAGPDQHAQESPIGELRRVINERSQKEASRSASVGSVVGPDRLGQCEARAEAADEPSAGSYPVG